jgi:hypothetical protein
MISDTVAVRATRTRSPLLSWPQIVALLSLTVLSRSTRLLGDADTYWHLAAGRWIIEHGRVPTTDPFSHSMAGAPWTAHEWFAEVVMALVHQAGGWPALVLFTVLCWAVALALLTRFLLARLEPIHALLFTGLAVAMSVIHLLARPHAFAMPLLVLWTTTLVSSSERSVSPPWWLVGVMILWANLHGSFTLGLALAAAIGFDAVIAASAGSRIALARRWFIFVTLCTAASMLTPAGWHGLFFTLHVMRMDLALSIIGEWQPPNFRAGNPLEIWLLLILGLGLAGRLRLPWLRLVVLLGLTHLALKHVRNVSVLGLVSPILLAKPFAHSWYAAPRRGTDAAWLDDFFRLLARPPLRRGWLVFTAIIVMVAAIIIPNGNIEPPHERAPSAALAAARKAGVTQTHVFNAYSFGGYLIHEGVPVHVDGRADMYGDEFLKRMLEATQSGAALSQYLDQHRIGWTLLEPDSAAVVLLDSRPGWQRLYADRFAVVHVRTALAPTAVHSRIDVTTKNPVM